MTGGRTVKRIVLYRFDRQAADGLIRPDSYLSPDPLEFLTSAGEIQSVLTREIKAICFVSEVGPADLFSSNTQFERRPKTAGLWARFILRDGDQLEGVLAQNLAEWPAHGFSLTPPRSGSARQRVYLPRSAVLSVALLGLNGAARSRPQPLAGKASQLRMFDQ